MSVTWLTEDDVREAIGLGDAIDIVRDALGDWAGGHSEPFPRTHVGWDAGNVYAIGAALHRPRRAGTKTWINTTAGAHAVLVLFDTDAARVVAVVEAGLIGALRTAATAAIATDGLAAPDADELALLGTGRQALLQVAAVQAVRPLRRVRVWSPGAESRERFAAAAGERFDAEVVPVADLGDAVRGAPIVTAVTRAEEPFLRAELLDPGAHVNAMGAILPHTAELFPDVLTGAGIVVADDVELARSFRELRDAALGPGAVHALRDLGERPAARHGRSVFASVGLGLGDVALAAAVHASAERTGRGQPITTGRPAMPAFGRIATTSAVPDPER